MSAITSIVLVDLAVLAAQAGISDAERQARSDELALAARKAPALVHWWACVRFGAAMGRIGAPPGDVLRAVLAMWHARTKPEPDEVPPCAGCSSPLCPDHGSEATR